MKAKEWFADCARGAALGTGILPGVSVGTVGMVVHVYDKLINSIDGIRKKQTFKSSFLQLLPIALGCVAAAVILLLFWQKAAKPYFPFVVVAALAGFVAGSLPLILVEIKGHKLNVWDFVRIALGFLVASSIGVLSYLSQAGVISGFDLEAAFLAPNENIYIYPLVLLVGFVAAVACLIPGISGSMVLFIFGLYSPVVGLFISSNTTPSMFHDTSRLGTGLILTALLLLGILIGFFVVSKAMKSLLSNHKIGTYTAVVGFVLGSLVSMFFNNEMYVAYHSEATNQPIQFIIGGILFFAVMAATYFLLARKQIKK